MAGPGVGLRLKNRRNWRGRGRAAPVKPCCRQCTLRAARAAVGRSTLLYSTVNPAELQCRGFEASSVEQRSAGMSLCRWELLRRQDCLCIVGRSHDRCCSGRDAASGGLASASRRRLQPPATAAAAHQAWPAASLPCSALPRCALLALVLPLLLAAPAASGRSGAGRARHIRKVSIVFSWHLDVGFNAWPGEPGLDSTVISRHLNDFFPRAARLAAQLRERGANGGGGERGRERLVVLTHVRGDVGRAVRGEGSSLAWQAACAQLLGANGWLPALSGCTRPPLLRSPARPAVLARLALPRLPRPHPHRLPQRHHGGRGPRGAAAGRHQLPRAAAQRPGTPGRAAGGARQQLRAPERLGCRASGLGGCMPAPALLCRAGTPHRRRTAHPFHQHIRGRRWYGTPSPCFRQPLPPRSLRTLLPSVCFKHPLALWSCTSPTCSSANRRLLRLRLPPCRWSCMMQTCCALAWAWPTPWTAAWACPPRPPPASATCRG